MQDFFSKILKLDITIDNECCIGIKAKVSAQQQNNSNACECMYLAAPYIKPHLRAQERMMLD